MCIFFVKKKKKLQINDLLVYIHKFIMIVCVFLDIYSSFYLIFKKYIKILFNSTLNTPKKPLVSKIQKLQNSNHTKPQGK